jgi:hypothetical protein
MISVIRQIPIKTEMNKKYEYPRHSQRKGDCGVRDEEK